MPSGPTGSGTSGSVSAVFFAAAFLAGAFLAASGSAFLAGAFFAADFLAVALTVLRVLEGRFGYADGARGTIAGDKRLICELTLRAGRVVWDWNARTGRDYREMPPTYGVRDVDRVIVPKP